jgi:alpha-glucosidase
VTTKAETAGAFRTTRISHRAVTGGTSVRLERLVDGYTPPEPYYTLWLLATARPSSVTIGATALPDAGSETGLAAATGDAYFWDAALETTVVKVFDTRADVTVTVLT